MIKLVSVTWSYTDKSDFENSILYQSFLKKNDKKDFYNIHFNRNNYLDLESNFNNKFGYQYEFLLYRIFLLKNVLETLDFDIIIFSDTNDVVCLDSITNINYSISNKITFSSEKHRYPNEISVTNWIPSYKYKDENNINKWYVNAGLSIGKKDQYISLFQNCIESIFPLEYKNFGGDQGVFSYYFINNEDGLIILDNKTEYFLSTYSDSPSNYVKIEKKIKNLTYNTFPFFIHDNGWNYGSPKFINYFNLTNDFCNDLFRNG